MQLGYLIIAVINNILFVRKSKTMLFVGYYLVNLQVIVAGFFINN